MAINFLFDVSVNSGIDLQNTSITSLATPVNNTDAATKAYVDSLVTASDLDFSGTNGIGAVDLDSQVFAVTGGTFVSTTASGQSLAIDLNATGTASATTFLRGDNSWSTPPDNNTTYTFAAVSGTPNLIRLTGTNPSSTNDIGLVATGNIAITFNSATSLGFDLASSISVSNTITAGTGLTVTTGGVDITGTGTFNTGISVIGNSSINGELDMSSNKIINVTDPTNAQDAATKNYVDITSTSGAVNFQGGYDAATNTPDLDSNPSSAIKKGWMYTVTADGTFFTEQVRTGDSLIAQIDAPTTLANWTTVQNNIDLADASTVGIGNVAGTANDIGVSYSAGTATVSQAAVALNQNTSSATPGSGGTFTAIDSVTTNSTGHLTDYNLKTVTLPTATISGSGTANYISKWNTTSALTNSLIYDTGTQLAIGTTSPDSGVTFQVGDGTVSEIVRIYDSSNQYIDLNGAGVYFTRTNSYLRPAGTAASQTLYIGDNLGGANPNRSWGAIRSNFNDFWFTDNGVKVMRIHDEKVGIGTGAVYPNTASEKLHVDGNFRLTGTFKDGSNGAGTSGQVLSSTGISTSWISLPADNNNYVTSASFATSTGVLTLSRQGLTAVTVDLDGRYLTGNQNITLTGDVTGGPSATSIATTISSNVVGADELNVSSNGTSGQVLTSDGLGAFTWSTPFTGDITGVTAGNGLTGGGTAGNVSLAVGAGTGIQVNATNVALATAGAGAGTYGSTSDSTKIDTITLDAYGRVTAVATGATGSGSVTGSGTASVTGGQIPYWDATTNITGTTELNYSTVSGGSVGRVGIGNNNATAFGTSRLVVGSGSGGANITLYGGASNTNGIAFANGTSGNAQYRGQVRYNLQNDNLEFLTNGETFSRVYVDSAFDLNLVERSLNFRNSWPYAVGAYIDIPSNNQLSIGTNGSERMRIDSSGNVGIGEQNPAYQLQVTNAANAILALTAGVADNQYAQILFGDSAGAAQGRIRYENFTDSMEFIANSTSAMLIDSSGNVGIGTTDTLSRKFRIYGSGDLVDITSTNTGIGGAQIDLRHESSSPANNDIVGIINFNGRDSGLSGTQYAGIQAIATDVSSETGALAFTTRTNASTYSEKMRIDSNGNIGVGTTSPINGGGNAKWITIDGVTGNNYSGGVIYSIGGSAKGYHYVQDNNIIHQGQAGVGHRFFANAGDAMTITSGRNVGIGTSSPSDRLNVVGTIRAQGHLINGATNSVRTGCTYSPTNVFISGENNIVGGFNSGVIGSNNSTPCPEAPWLALGGNFIAGMYNTINSGYSHANAIFGQNNTLADNVTQQAEAGSLMSGNGNILFGTNSFSWGYQTFAQTNESLTGGYQSVSFGIAGSMSVGLGCTASTGATQYAFGTGVTTPTTATAAEISDQFAIGKFNVYATSIGHLFAIGNGTSDGARNTALAVIGEGTYTNGQLSLNDVNGYSSSTYNSRLHVSGNATKTTGSSWISVSDERLKSNIQVYEKGLPEILQITPKTFQFNGKAGTQVGQSQVGIIAQEIKDILPESINTFNKKLEETDETETELYDFNQDPLVYTLLNAVKELSAKIDTLENRIQTLEAN